MKLWKKYITTFLLFFGLCLLFSINATAMNPITVYLNNKILTFDVDPTIENGTTLVPMRKIFESLGATVSYDKRSQTVIALKNGAEINLVIGSKYPSINGEKKAIEVPAKIVNGRTLVPLRFVSETLGARVSWDNENKTITIESSKKGSFNVISIY